jgi:glycosyltransferase involved in cell wall biosynthesis
MWPLVREVEGTPGGCGAISEPVGRPAQMPPTALLLGKKVVIVLGSLDLGGAERQAVHLARYLIRHCAASVKVWGLSEPGRTSELCQNGGIPWRSVALTFGRTRVTHWPRAVLAFSDLLRREAPDIVLPYTSTPNIVCGLSWRLCGAKTCVWNQRDEGIGLVGSLRAARLAIRNTPAFVSNSVAGVDYLCQTFNLSADRISVIPNGVELEPPRHSPGYWLNLLGIPKGCITACMVANIHEYKGHATALRAWQIVMRQLRTRGRDAVLLLAGGLDRQADALKALAFDLELGRSVRFLGRVDDVSALLSEVTMGVFSSTTEGCPNGLLECMASGLPVVATDIPGIREAVGRDGYDWLCPPGDAQMFAEKVLLLADHQETRSRLGQANRKRVHTQFSIDRMGSAMVQVLAMASLKRHWSFFHTWAGDHC